MATELGLTAWSDRGNANSAGCADHPESTLTNATVALETGCHLPAAIAARTPAG